MKNNILLTIFFSLIIMVSSTNAQVQRPYEPIIITGDTLDLFLNHEIKNMYLFSYNANDNIWRLIPFQIDEVNPAVNDSVKYFIAEDSLGGILDADDELVFMASDLGDKANDSSWVAETDSNRLELVFTDPLDNNVSYTYLYSSASLNEQIPDYFRMTYDSLNDRIHSTNYEVGFNNTGQLGDVLIKSEIGGSGEDIFDRVKIRAIGSWWILPVYLSEENIKSKYAYAKTGPVRIIRNMVGNFTYDLLNFDENFTQTSFFYPWHGSFRLVDIPLGQAKDVGAQVDRLRVSWDFSDKAIGMKFYSENNRSGFPIDGFADQIDSTCFPGELNWTMGTGESGTILNNFNIPSFGDTIILYYHEATDGSTDDDSPGLEFETGDFLSFADNGYILKDNIENYITNETTFSFLYYNFFLPPDFDPEDASLINDQMKTPLSYTTKSQTYSPPLTRIVDNNIMKPGELFLVQNYPNPFNSLTTISFRLASKGFVSLRIYDSLGRLVKTVTEQNLIEGFHKFKWNGKNKNGTPVPSGIYFYRMVTNNFSATRKLILIK